MVDSFVSVDGLSLAYVEEGEGAPILYVHGNTGSKRWFERVMRLPGHRVIAVDMPNFGFSDPLAGTVDLDRYADVVAAFVKAKGIDRPILVGHSLGGAVAISLVSRYPALWRGLILVDSGPPSGLVTPEDRHPLIEMMRQNPAFLAQALKAVVPTLADEAFFQALVADASRMASPAWVGNAIALSRFDYRGKCSSFEGPALVLWGRKDVIVTEPMARETAEAFPNARLEILEGVGHSVMVEDPGLFLRLVADFAAAAGRD